MSPSGREVGRGSELALGLETVDALLQRRDGAVQCLRAEDQAQRRRLSVDTRTAKGWVAASISALAAAL